MPSIPFVTQTVSIASGASAMAAALDTEGWMVAALELPSGLQGSFLEIRTGDTATVRRVFLSDASAATAAMLKLPSDVSSAAVILQVEPLLTLGRQFISLNTVQSDGTTAQTQSAARSIKVFLVKPGSF